MGKEKRYFGGTVTSIVFVKTEAVYQTRGLDTQIGSGSSREIIP
ncbi:MAG: hypothetical protein ABH817_00500 [archaeon]